jgi:hypothetical protein
MLSQTQPPEWLKATLEAMDRTSYETGSIGKQVLFS